MSLNRFYSLILFILLSKLTTSGSSTNQKQKDSYPKLQSQLLAFQEVKHNNETFYDPTDYSSVRVTITSCVFNSCFSYEMIESHYGGALYFVFSASTITKTLFYNCAASLGGAIFAHDSRMTITNTNFTNNQALESGAVVLYQCANFKITGGFSMYNEANSHSCFDVHESNGTIESHNFISNTAEDDCACVSIHESQAKIEGCYFVQNKAGLIPGALQIEEGEDEELITSCIIKNCYFIENYAVGEPIHVHINGNVTGSITNCVFDVDLKEAIFEYRSPNFKYEHNTINPNVKTPFESLFENKQEVIKYSKVFDHSKSDYIAGFFIALIPVYVGIVFIILIKD